MLITNIAIEDGHTNSEFSQLIRLLKMAIETLSFPIEHGDFPYSYSYAGLPEGTFNHRY